MSRWKAIEYIAQNDAGTVDKMVVTFHVSADGSFYAHVPERLEKSFDPELITRRARAPKGFFVASAATFKELDKAIKAAHELLLTPKITEEPVILYNIESHVSFAVDDEGHIFPNAGYPGARWQFEKENKESYGDHHALDRAPGGYSLTVGAKAMMKKTIAYGDNSTVEYDYYYKDGDHHGRENPAEKLNSWVSFSLPENPKEMPYSDEAALFFFGLMMSMAELNRRIQEFTNTPEKLALAIKRHSNLMLLEGPKK